MNFIQIKANKRNMQFLKSQSQAGENLGNIIKKNSFRPGLVDMGSISGSITFYLRQIN